MSDDNKCKMCGDLQNIFTQYTQMPDKHGETIGCVVKIPCPECTKGNFVVEDRIPSAWHYVDARITGQDIRSTVYDMDEVRRIEQKQKESL